jgi:hypothetical protein
MSSDTEKTEVFQSNNQQYVNANMLQLRLNTEELIMKIERFLRGSYIEYEENEEGKIISKYIKSGEPKANDIGIQAILSFITAIINTQTVQGNFNRDEYKFYIYELHMDLIEMLLINMHRWRIEDDDVEPICDFILLLSIPFISRLIDNKERDSYSSTMKHIESNSMQKNGALNFFKS